MSKIPNISHMIPRIDYVECNSLSAALEWSYQQNCIIAYIIRDAVLNTKKVPIQSGLSERKQDE